MGKQDGLYKRGERWVIRTDPITGRPRSTGKRDKAAALAVLRRREREAADPAHAAASEATLAKWAGRLVALKRSTKAAGTASMYEQKIGHALRIGGEGFRMAQVTPGWVDAYFATRREETAAETTLGKELTAIVQVCKLAKRAGEYNQDIGSLRPPGFSPKSAAKDRWLTPEELRAMLCQLPPEKAAHMAFVVATGARRGEADRAQPEDIDRARDIVRIRGTKTAGSRREIPILNGLRELLDGAAPYLPLSRWTNSLRDMARAAKRAGIPRCTWNDLRRTTGTWLVTWGVSFEIIAKILGHATAVMLYRHYGKARAEQLGAVAESQIATTTKTLQSRAEDSKTASGPVAQPVELRIFNPLQWSEAIAESALLEPEAGDEGSPGDAEGRPGPHGNVTAADVPRAVDAMGAELAAFASDALLERVLGEAGEGP